MSHRGDHVVNDRAKESTRGPCRLCIIVPCYNEEEVLPLSVPRLADLLGRMIEAGLCHQESFVLLVDDGSGDATWDVVVSMARRFPRRVRGVRLALNFGHQNAMLCGLDYVTGRCDAAVSLDADLQHDIDAIPKMVEAYREGAEIVLGVRESHGSESWFKRTTSVGFYRTMRLLGVDLVENHADFRLLSDKALRNLGGFGEYHVFLRGMSPLLHRKIAVVSCEQQKRFAGGTKYSIPKMLALAWNGVTSFSVRPLRLISIIGLLVFAFSLIMVAYAAVGFLAGATVPGWASIVVPLYFLGGLLMLSIGIVGEYVGKLFLEVKRRPRFLIDATVGDGVDNGQPIDR